MCTAIVTESPDRLEALVINLCFSLARPWTLLLIASGLCGCGGSREVSRSASPTVPQAAPQAAETPKVEAGDRAQTAGTDHCEDQLKALREATDPHLGNIGEPNGGMSGVFERAKLMMAQELIDESMRAKLRELKF